MSFPRVIIIILNWNGKDITADCLGSLCAVTYPNFGILLVDNGSEDGSVAFLRERFPGLEVIENGSNLGFAEGNNVGIRRVLEKGADYVLLLNNDTIVDPGFLDGLVRAAGTDGNIGFAGPKTYFYDHNGRKDIISFAGGLLDMWRGKSIHIGEKCEDRGQFDNNRNVDYVEGSCMLARTDMVRKIGMMDPAYFAYWEETDWCVRAAKAGYRSVYVPSSRIWHRVNASSIGSSNIYYLTRNRLWFMRKYARPTQFITFLVFFTGYFLEMNRHFLFHRNTNGLKALYKGLRDGITSWPW